MITPLHSQQNSPNFKRIELRMETVNLSKREQHDKTAENRIPTIFFYYSMELFFKQQISLKNISAHCGLCFCLGRE